MIAGDQIITLVEIDQPLCQLEYGFTPCQAQLGVTGTRKCHNSRATCQDAAAYSPAPLPLRFSRPQDALLPYGPLLPILANDDTSPASVNLAAMEKSSSGFGQREKVTLKMDDVLHSDLLVDKYRLERITGEAAALESWVDIDFLSGALAPRFGQFSGRGVVTVTRAANTATRVNASGAVEVVNANLPRFDYDPVSLQCKGLLIEEARTNSLRNNTMQGVVAGSPGTVPTNWLDNVGVTRTIVGSGVSNGIEYIDIRWNGITPTTFGNLAFEPTTQIAGANGQNWSTSCYIALVGGSVANIDGIRVRGALFSAVPVYLGETVANPPDLSASLRAAMQRFTTSGPTVASTAWVQPYLQMTWSAGVAVDFTLRIGLPQMELGAAASSVIKTTSAAVTRNADSPAMSSIAGWFKPLQGTVVGEWRVGAAGQRYAVTFRNAGTTDILAVRQASTGAAGFLDIVASVSQADLANGPVLAVGDVVRAVGSYALNDFAVSAGGLSSSLDGAASLPVVDTLEFGNLGGGQFLNGHLRRFTYYPRKLEEADRLAISGSTEPPEAVVPFLGTYDPYTSGTFWGKWLARNPYHSGYPVRIYEGVIGEPVDYMRVRNYLIDRVEGPSDGQVTITCKDLFSQVEARKALAPLQSSGELKFDITAVAGSLTLNPAGIGDALNALGAPEYPTAGHVCIGTECIAYTRTPGSDVLTLTTRAALNTKADLHHVQDLVQLVLSFVSAPPHQIARDLLTNFVGMVDGVDFDYADWTAKAAEIIDLYTARVVEPTAVSDLIGEIEQLAGFTLWPDVVDNKIKFTALRAATPNETVDDASWIKDGSLSLSKLDSARVSEVWVHYGQINPTVSLGDRKNYFSTLIEDDQEAESPTQYDGITVREVFSRWIPQFGRDAATRTAQRLLAMFRDAPLQAEFTMYADKAGRLSYSDYFNLLVDEVQDEFGQPTPVAMAPLTIENGDDFVSIKAQAVKFPQAPPPGASETFVYIENDAFNLTMRSIYDSLFAEPVGTEIVTFVVEAGVRVGSTSTGAPALQTGSWPVGVTLKLLNHGRIAGMGGAAGVGGGFYEGAAGSVGSAGGPALQVTYPLSVDNTDGQIWGGGGGGGGGALGHLGGTGLYQGGGGGGGGAGINSGAGAAAGTNMNFNPLFPPAGQPGSTGGPDAGGAGGAGASFGSPPDFSGNGGNGGDPGQAGSAGTNAGGPNTIAQAGSAGGAAGNYIVGNALVTWLANGDRRGGVVA